MSKTTVKKISPDDLEFQYMLNRARSLSLDKLSYIMGCLSERGDMITNFDRGTHLMSNEECIQKIINMNNEIAYQLGLK